MYVYIGWVFIFGDYGIIRGEELKADKFTVVGKSEF